MNDKQHEEAIRLNDTGQPKAVTATFTVTLTMTHQQRDAYGTDHGVGFVGMEVKSRFPREAEEALCGIGWVGEYARVRVESATLEEG